MSQRVGAFHDNMGVPLFQKCGKKTCMKLIDIEKVAVTLSIDSCRVLIVMHIYSGCNNVSTFAGKGPETIEH